jgi:hypothetical protein
MCVKDNGGAIVLYRGKFLKYEKKFHEELVL